MTVRLPWFSFYVDRFVKETSLLNPIEVAVFYRFLESYAQNGYLPDDTYILQEIARLDSALAVLDAMMGGAKPDREAWDMIKAGTINKVLNQFFALDGEGHYHHAGWDKELHKSQKKYADGVKRAAITNEKRRAGADVMAEAAATGETLDAPPPDVIQ